jgi:hypothetical protein
MREGSFPFFRATFYRWAQVFPVVCPQLASAPEVLGVGDLHVENFGTWRDAEGRLVWGVNDFDEAFRLPYTNDLVRLAASVAVASAEQCLRLDPRGAAEAILEGYRKGLECGGRPLVLGERHPALYHIAAARLGDPAAFWAKMDAQRPVRGPVPDGAGKALRRMLPEPGLPHRFLARVAGLGSLGRQRFVAVAEWHGGRVAREAKALAPSAWLWAAGESGGKVLYGKILDRAVRCPDPFVKVKDGWIVRRLSPDCSRIELANLPRERDEARMLHAMGFETANVHLGSHKAVARVREDLLERGGRWLERAAADMAERVAREWGNWRECTRYQRTIFN